LLNVITRLDAVSQIDEVVQDIQPAAFQPHHAAARTFSEQRRGNVPVENRAGDFPGNAPLVLITKRCDCPLYRQFIDTSKESLIEHTSDKTANIACRGAQTDIVHVYQRDSLPILQEIIQMQIAMERGDRLFTQQPGAATQPINQRPYTLAARRPGLSKQMPRLLQLHQPIIEAEQPGTRDGRPV